MDLQAIMQATDHLVANMRRGESYDVRVDRQSSWGNPFVSGKDGTREEVVREYHRHLQFRVRSGQLAIEDLASLAGKRLGCWCSPSLCHAHVLAWAALRCKEHLAERSSTKEQS